MKSSNKPILSNIISLSVCDEVTVSESFGATFCSFVVFDKVSIGYQYAGHEDTEDALNRAFDILFDETRKRLKAKKSV